MIKDRAELGKLYGVMGLNKAPQVDMNKDMVLAVFLGEKRSRGYSIEITKIEEKTDSLEVYVKETTPKPSSMCTMAFSQPYHLIKTATSDKEVTFIK